MAFSSAKAIRELGYPRSSARDALAKAVRWYRENEWWWRDICAKPEYQDFVKAFYGPGLGTDL